ncbi:hypothetical protein EV126DRAFT_432206 [Verticillium dahliae]|nr:hypothetical protein EV126DRAFT_432206 [Verticillium dahliae]
MIACHPMPLSSSFLHTIFSCPLPWHLLTACVCRLAWTQCEEPMTCRGDSIPCKVRPYTMEHFAAYACTMCGLPVSDERVERSRRVL